MKKFTHFFLLSSVLLTQSSYGQVLLNTKLPEVKETILPFKKSEQTTDPNIPKWTFLEAKEVLPNYVPGEIYVKFKENSEEYKSLRPDINGQVSFLQLSFLKTIFTKYNVEEFYNSFNGADSPFLQSSFRMKIADDAKIDQVIRELLAKQYIETVVKVPLFKLFLTPNDPYYSITSTYQGYTLNWNWHLDKIKATEAWDISTGSSTVKVAIVDNAVYTAHPDLSSKIVGQYDVADNDAIASPPTSVTLESSRYTWSHGTHAAGLAGAITNNNVGIASIGYNVSIIAIKCTKNSSSPEALSAGYEGITKAADLDAHVINMSFGGPMSSTSEQNYGQSVINYAYNKGCVLVAAAGNEGDQGNEISYPANFNHVIAVGATNGNDKKADFSQFGTWIDVMAPGGNDVLGGVPFLPLLSTTWSQAYGLKDLYGLTSATSNPFLNTYYDGMQGTSMASPIVAGLAGLIKSAKSTLTADQITNCIISTADNINSVNNTYIGKIGSGRINAKAALECAIGTTTNPNPGTNNSCDTVNLNLVQIGTWTPASYTFATGNYILGVNSYNDKEIYQYYDLSNSTSTIVSGAIIGVTATTIVGTSKTLKVSVYNSNGGVPGTLIGSTTYGAPALTQAGYLIFDFGTSFTLPANKKFFIGVDFTGLSYAAGDRLGLMSNTQGETTPSSVYVKESSNTVSNIDATMQSALNISSLIMPIVSESSPNATITPSNSTVNCNTNVTFQATGTSNVSAYEWTIAGGSPSTGAASSIISKFNSNGSKTISLEIKNSCGATKTITATVNVSGCEGSQPTSIENQSEEKIISSYYAPISQEFVVEFNLNSNQDFIFRLVNTVGQVMYNGQLNAIEGKSTYRVNANMFPTGVYVLQLLNKDTQYSNKMIVR